MYPLVEQTLSLFDVAKHWQRVINARVDKWDVHEVLHRAWWQGEFEAGGLSESLRRKALMIMRELPPEDQGGIVFYEHEDELPPATIWHGDELEVVDYRSRIRLPVDPASWTETEITEACEALAEVPPENLPSVIQVPLLAVRIERDVFAAWCDQMGWDRPSFWFSQAKPSARVRATTAARTGCRRLLRELVSRGKRLPKGRVKDLALERFPELPVAEFKRIWKQNVPAEWQLPGRLRKQSARINSVR